MISDKLISFIVQGPIVPQGEFATTNVVNSIRRYFPSAEIILSTWKDEPLHDIKADIFVQSDLPPAFEVDNNQMCNINRQIVSTIEGIKRASRPYVVKTRTNTLFTSNDVLSLFNDDKASSVFRQKVFTIEYFTRDAYKGYLFNKYDAYLHHPSDIFLLGLKEDVAALFSCKHASREVMLNGGKRPLVAEQYLWMTMLIKSGKIKNYKTPKIRYNPLQAYYSEKWLFENFVVLNHVEAGIKLEERLVNGWLADCLITARLQRQYDKKSTLSKNAFLLSRAIYYTVFQNRFFRKMFRKKVY